ncbi:hypothetical protein B0E41_19760 [Hydrogenophaga sp. A37]|nr:hypothetical protein B0E41_19760 [Hydrogenophaga sp. A37]
MAAALAALLLGGCASTYRVDSQVESFANWTETGSASGKQATAPAALPQAPQTYRFERLPSQREGDPGARQNALESYARDALAPLGWTAVDSAASPWTVQVSASSLRLARSPWDDPWPIFWPMWGVGVGSHGPRVSGQLVWGPMFPPMYNDRPYYQRKLTLVVREARSGRVVYETHAAHDGLWADSPGLWRAMVSAALHGFPAPPAGARQVNVDLPR